jgi:hypothetical protein
MKFHNDKYEYSWVFYRVGPGCRGFAKFITRDQDVGFPGEGYTRNFIVTDVEFHTAVVQPYIELMSDCSRLQSGGDLTAW